MAYEIRTYREGYRRGGMAHSTTAVVHPEGTFTEEQLRAPDHMKVYTFGKPDLPTLLVGN